MSVQHKFEVGLARTAERNLDQTKLKSAIQYVVSRALAGGRDQRGWSVKALWDNANTNGDGKVHYGVKLKVVCKPARQRRPEVLQAEAENITKVIEAAASSKGWFLAGSDGKVPAKVVDYASLKVPLDWRDFFEHIYERDAQIDLIMSALEAGIISNFQDRFHVALVGEPASGKTELLRSFAAMLGPECVLEYSATETTQAGAIRDLAERQILPRVLIVEEIEKADENSLRWLLAAMDHRAEIRKVNYRQQVHKEVRMLTMATVNNYKLFTDMMSGALASRFCYHLYCDRPNRQLLQRILEREVKRVAGKTEWIKPALDFAEDRKISDPRKVTAFCLCGRDELLTGKYQEKLAATIKNLV